jgi:hypothetical protein
VLMEKGLSPILIKLGDVDVSVGVHASSALSKAVVTGSEVQVDDVFLQGRIFDERVPFGSAEICPYILILDAWDEVNVSAAEGYRARIARLLEQIRSTYLSRQPRVRVILTGRPSDDVMESQFFRLETRLLTLRPLRPERLADLLANLAKHLEIPDRRSVGDLAEHYAREFKRARDNGRKLSGTADVLGAPLLTFLVAKLMSQSDPAVAHIMTGKSTQLYRRLVDMTCAKAGKAPDDPAGTEGQYRIAGLDLRTLLWKTASVITTLGEESISHNELQLRLGEEHLSDVSNSLTRDNTLSALMISFYFKTGHKELGCEFLHKSFREYLHAEHIVGELKKYGEVALGSLPGREYWKDFSPDDPRHYLVRQLCELIAPQWLTKEVRQHLIELLDWEVGRSATDAAPTGEAVGASLPSISFHQWESIRDALADLWAWWADGAHLRPQVERRKGQQDIDWISPYAHELVQYSAPSSRKPNALPNPIRTVTVDAHLGDGLFQLASETHFLMARATGWLAEPFKPEELWGQADRVAKLYQTIVRRNDTKFILFRPHGAEPSFFAWFASRINSAGWRPEGYFPKGTSARGADFAATSIVCVPWDWFQSITDWSNCNLEGCHATGGNFGRDLFNGVYARYADFSHANVVSAHFEYADLRDSDFGLMWQDTSFDTALLDGAKGFSQADCKRR